MWRGQKGDDQLQWQKVFNHCSCHPGDHPMNILTSLRRLASSAAVFFGHHGAVSQLARGRQQSRQALYRDADRVLQALQQQAAQDPTEPLQQALQQAQRTIDHLERQLAQAVVLDEDRQAEFASTAQAEGISLPQAQRLLRVLLKEQTPSVAQLGTYSQEAARRATTLLAELDQLVRPKAEQVVADEIYCGKTPILMIVEPDSWCWLSGRRVQRLDGAAWLEELRPLTQLQSIVTDAGKQLGHGVRLLQAQRRQAKQTVPVHGLDIFHTFREGQRVLRRRWQRAEKALHKAADLQQRSDRLERQGRPRRLNSKQGRLNMWPSVAWRAAEAAFEQASREEQAWHEVQRAFALFTPQGQLNNRTQAEAELARLLPQLPGPDWAKARRLVQRPEALTFLDRLSKQVQALPLDGASRTTLLRLEGLRRCPERLRERGPSGAVARGLALVGSVQLAKTEGDWPEQAAALRGVLRRCVRASSAVEGINSVLRMQQARHRRLSQGLLDLKRLYWNCRRLRTGRRKGQTPYGLLGVQLPVSDWWELLKIPPEQLRQQLSTKQLAA
jgi:hypothetical protein